MPRFNERDHPRWPKGTGDKAGEFRGTGGGAKALAGKGRKLASSKAGKKSSRADKGRKLVDNGKGKTSGDAKIKRQREIEGDIGGGERYPYIRVARKNPTEDQSVVGWAPNSVHVEQAPSYEEYEDEQDVDAIIEELEDRGMIVGFSGEDLQEALDNDTVDDLPQLKVGGVASFEAESLDDWVEINLPALESMGYFRNGQLDQDAGFGEGEMKIWALNGEDQDIEDIEGVYVKAEEAVDITELALEKIARKKRS